MQPNMNQTTVPDILVRVHYRLSPAGQRAALLQGKPAAADNYCELPIESPDQLAQLEIDSKGIPSLTLLCVAGFHTGPELDAPPSSLGELLAIRQRAVDAIEQKKQREQQEAADREAARLARIEEDRSAVEELLTAAAAADPLGPMGFVNYPTFIVAKGAARQCYLAPEHFPRIQALWDRKAKAEKDREDAEKAAKEVATEKMLDTYGGHRWELSSGFCDFRGFNLWLSGQSKRWVGIFTQPRGIDSFLSSPKGEFTWDISSLTRGQCIQGAGFDTNSRGKRRSESEWFGVVIANDDALVIRLAGSRAEAFKIAAGLGK